MNTKQKIYAEMTRNMTTTGDVMEAAWLTCQWVETEIFAAGGTTEQAENAVSVTMEILAESIIEAATA
jgi:hypothetical protein